jgi:hypothetical protein
MWHRPESQSEDFSPMKNEEETQKTETTNEPATSQQDETTGDGEFKLTVRKLEMPVRPRGVLAE